VKDLGPIRLLGAAGLVLFLAVAPPAAGATSPLGAQVASGKPPAALAAKRDELKRVRVKLEAERLRLEATRRRERRSSTEIQRLDREREATEHRLASLVTQQHRLRMQAAAAAAALARAETGLARRRSVLADRIVDMNKYGRAGYLDVVLGATSFPEFVARARMVGEVVHEDTQMIQAYTADRDRTAQLREQLDSQQAQLRAVVRETEDRQETLQSQIAAKRDTLRAIVRERAAAEQAVRELEEDSAALEGLIQRLQPSGTGFGPRLAAFLWPLRGPVTSRFGFRIHPLFRRREFHTGVDIAASRGAPVHAAFEGTVIFAGWYGGYGKLVIVDHGNGLSTLYGHLAEILVTPGQHVTRAEVLGLVGSTGFATGPHLHYEVRENGRPVDPPR
jgi:murein DD-endopeptidase MepM/ murein hydrolase activator NlpD